jgi:inner membrane protein
MLGLTLFTPAFWAVAGVLLVVLEILAPGFFLVWFAAAALLTAAAVLALGDPAPVVQAALFTALSALLVGGALAWRRRAPAGGQADEAAAINDRAAQKLGVVARLDEPLSGGRGRLFIGDTLWQVEGPDLPAGTRVRVAGHDGTTLKVEPVEGTEP